MANVRTIADLPSTAVGKMIGGPLLFDMRKQADSRTSKRSFSSWLCTHPMIVSLYGSEVKECLQFLTNDMTVVDLRMLAMSYLINELGFTSRELRIDKPNESAPTSEQDKFKRVSACIDELVETANLRNSKETQVLLRLFQRY